MTKQWTSAKCAHVCATEICEESACHISLGFSELPLNTTDEDKK